jgi:hypothetical protein
VATVAVLTLGLVLPDSDAFARGRGGRARGSVRSVNRNPGGGGSWSGPRSQGTTTQTRSGDSSYRSTSVEGRGGQSATGTRDVTRDGDTLTVDRQVQGNEGGSASKQKEYEFDDGRLDSVERDVQATDRYGRSADYEGKAEREGYGWEFDGEGHNRWGQKVEADGYGARGYYGSGVVADVEGGRYGDRTVVAGRTYGGPGWATQLPYGARPYTYWGRPYYGYGGHYYRPYTYGGVAHYCYIPPPYGVYYPAAPVGAIALTVVGASLLYSDGAYYKETYVDGATQYQVVPAPEGATIPGTALPADRATVTVGGVTYYFYGNTFYKRVVTDGKESFVAVTKPAGVITVEALPPEFEPVTAGSLTYFQAKGRYYLTYLTPKGDELYLVVDPPPAGAVAAASPGPPAAPGTPAATTTGAAAPQPVYSTLTVPAGTTLLVRVTSEISSGSAKNGDLFQGYLEQDAVVQGRLVAARGAKAWGRVVEAKSGTGLGADPALGLQLTDIDVGGHVVAVTTETQAFTAEGKKPAKKIIGGAALGAGIGAIIDGGEGAAWGAGVGAVAGTAAAAGSSGNQVAVGAGTALEFRLAQPVSIDVLTEVAAAR